MYQYFAINIIYSLLIFVYLYLLKTAPFRIRFRFVALALVSWLLPYDLINNLFSQGNPIAFSSTITEFSVSIKQAIISQVKNETFLTLLNLIKAMTAVGFIIFVKDILALKTKLNKLSLATSFYKKIKGVAIYKVKNSDSVFSVGLLNPKIYLGEQHINSPYVDSIIMHEIQHITHNDPLWLLFITFVQRLLWWNPIVYLLTIKGRELIELRCDQACNEQSDSNKYQQDLSQLLIQTHQKSNPLASYFFGQSTLNIYRIKQLSKEFKMNNKNKALIFSTALIPFVLMLFVSTASISSEETNTRVENEQGERAENEVDLTIKFNYIEYKKTNPETVSTTNLFEHRSNIKYEAAFDFIQGVNTGGEDRFYRYKATPKRVDDERIIIEFDIKYTSSKGRKITKSLSLMVLNGNVASVVLDDEADDYKIVIEVLPRF